MPPPRFNVRTCTFGRSFAFAVFLLVTVASMGCGSQGPAQSAVQAPGPAPGLPPAVKASEPVLLYVGKGTSSTDVSAVENILKSLNLGYVTADESQLNAITEAQLGGYKLLLVPGGNSITIGENLSTDTTTTIRNAVSQYGVHYLGICAGAFFGGYSIYNGLDLTSGVSFDFYADEFKGIHLEPVEITLPNASLLDAYWNDGPQLSGWGSIVAKYPDGTPAIVEGMMGNGFVLLAGVHLEAPAGWREGMKFTTPVSVDIAYAGTMIQAAMKGTLLPHF